MKNNFRAGLKEQGQRVDVFLVAQLPGYSRAFVQKMIRDGGVTRNGSAIKASARLESGDTLIIDERCFAPSSADASLEAWEGKAPGVLFEDDCVLVIDKPAGLVAHPAPSHDGVTLVGWLKTYLKPAVLKTFTDPDRLGLVHRLDKDTSGVLVIAKTVPASVSLGEQFRNREVVKTYNAWIEGCPSSREGFISAPVGRSVQNPRRMDISSHGRSAQTTFKVIDDYQEVSFVALFPKTGRTHQLRVHLAAIGHPVVGDHTYGSSPRWMETFHLPRLLLHAKGLSFRHPTSAKRMEFEAPLPDDFKKARAQFKKAFAHAACAAVVLLGLTVSGWTETTTTKKKSSAATSTSTSTKSSGSSTSKLQKEVAALSAELTALKEQLASVQASLDEMSGSRRLQDLEQAVAQLNGRAVSTSASAEEAKTQMLEVNRRLKTLQDGNDQARDQVDRLQREMIQLKKGQESLQQQLSFRDSPAPASDGVKKR